MTTIADIRKQYPQYSDISDAQLADGFYAKFYSDMPKEEFYKSINFSTEPVKQAPEEKPRTGMQEVGRQAGLTGRTLYEAFTAPATAALDFGAGLYNAGANLVGSESRLPYASQRQAEMLNKIGAPTPETTAEKIAQGGISGLAGQAGMAKAIPSVAGSLARSLPSAAAGGAVAQPVAELATDITGNPLVGQALGMGASMVAGGAAGKAGGMLEPKINTLTIPEVRARAAANYAKMDEAGVTVKPKSALDMVGNLRTELDNNNFIPKTDTKIANALDTFQEIIGTERVPFNKIEKLRSIATNLSNDADSNTRRLGKVMVEGVDDYISSLTGRDIIAGKDGLDKSVQAVMAERKDWRAASKAQVVQDAFDTADARANNPKKSEAELVRTQLENILANKKKRNMFNEAEINAMKSVVGGGPVENFLSILSRFDPRKSHLSAGATGGAIIYDPLIGGALAGGGMAAETALSAMKRRQIEALTRSIASGTAKDQPNYKYQGLLGGFMSQP
jgi:hypothetical protein